MPDAAGIFGLSILVAGLWVLATDAVKVRRFRRELDRWDGQRHDLSRGR